MMKINKKGEVILTSFFFLLGTFLLAFYVAGENGVFDSRSRALEELSPSLKFADLDGDSTVGMSDFSIWLRDYRIYKSDKSVLNSRSDFDEDRIISLSDFSMWLSAFREYKSVSIEDTSRVDVLTVEAEGECRDFELQGEIKDDGGSEILERGFIYSSTVTTPGLEDVSSGNAIKVDVPKDSPFKKSLDSTQLAASTKYYYRAFARNQVGYSFGEVKEFTTMLPGVDTNGFELTEGFVGFNVTMSGRANDCGLGIKDKGFIYSTSNSKDSNLRLKKSGVKTISAEKNPDPNYSAEVRSLPKGKTYYYRAYAINDKNVTSYGEIDQFETRTLYATTFEAEGVGEEKATLNGRIGGSDLAVVAGRGFVYSSSNTNPVLGGGDVTSVKVPGEKGDYSLPLKGLVKGKKYYFKAYVEDSNGGIFYGKVKSFKTKSLVVLTTNEAVGVTETGADLVGLVVSSALKIQRIGFVYSSTDTAPVLTAGNVTVKNVCVGTKCSRVSGKDVGVSVSGLLPKTKYYFRIFGENSDGVSYGEVKNFTTK